MVLGAAALSLAGCLAGMAFSLATDWPAGASIVAVNIVFFLFSLAYGRGRRG
jgi:ABC-type Mn2+/Zn2+ transport system permease subunit